MRRRFVIARFAASVPLVDRMFARTDRTGGCWRWLGTISGSNGYGYIGYQGKNVSAHRWWYEHVKGAIPSGLQIDHLCRNRWCVNPTHLEAVTIRENVRRGENFIAKFARAKTCLRGHALKPRGNSKGRFCPQCQLQRTRSWRRRHVFTMGPRAWESRPSRTGGGDE